VLSISELKSLAKQLKAPAFTEQLGPFALIQKPPGLLADGTRKMGLPAAAAKTATANLAQLSQNALALIFQFDDLVVLTLPPLAGVDSLTVGRQPDCEVVVDHPSVSKKHATVRWDEASKRCTVQDQASTNGTFLNASTRLKRETELRDGDIISFGEVEFWFLLTPTLHHRLVTPVYSPRI
jgi:hypothetical protein